MRLLWAIALAITCIISVDALKLTATGGTISGKTTPTQIALGMGHAHQESDAWLWYSYLNPGLFRVFINSIENWASLLNNRGKLAWGKSFDMKLITTQTEFNAAVTQLRSWKQSGKTFREWLLADPNVNWQPLYDKLEKTNEESKLTRCSGNYKNTLTQLSARNIKVQAVWQVRCSSVAWDLTNTATIYRSGWEIYRWFYIGAQWMADYNIQQVELYNEPDGADCESTAQWNYDYKARSMALQDGYADYRSTHSGSNIAVETIAPPAASVNDDEYTRLSIAAQTTTFSRGVVSGWKNTRAVSYHHYNTHTGANMLNNYQNTVNMLNSNGNQASSTPIYVTEINCYTGGVSEENYPGTDIIDRPATATCAANRLQYLFDRSKLIVLFKASQTYSTGPSGVAKNGVMFANNDIYPYHIWGTTKTAETYRLLLRKSNGGKAFWKFNTDATPSEYYRHYMVNDALAYYFYSINEQSSSQSLALYLSSLPGVTASTYIVISAVNGTHHAEVSSLQKLSSSKTFSFSQPGYTTVMITIPKVAFTKQDLLVSADATLFGGSKSGSNNGGGSRLKVYTPPSTTTDQSSTAVALLKFDTSSLTLSKTISAVLWLKLANTTAPSGTNQILTVFGVPDTWSELTATWSNIAALRTLSNGETISSTDKNFINWSSSGLKIVAHISVPGGSAATSKVVYTDVTDYVKGGGKAFLIARMNRFDVRGADGSYQLPADSPKGLHTFISKQTTGTSAPRLVILRQN